jgi:hypothetical protein
MAETERNAAGTTGRLKKLEASYRAVAEDFAKLS